MDMRAKRYAQCGLSETSLQNLKNYNIFLTCHQDAKMGPEMRREKRYAQWRFVDVSVLKRFMLGQVCSVFYNFAKAMSIGANIKTLKFHWKYVHF